MRISVAEFSGEDFRLGFATKAGRNYRVEYTFDHGSGMWTAVTSAERIAATGSLRSVLDVAARSQPQRLYGVREVHWCIQHRC